MTVHRPVVAGTFYPGAADALDGMVRALLADAPPLDVPPPKAVILPHAGYRYSGAVAAAGVTALAPGTRRVVVLGPSHRFAFRGVALPPATAMRTPLGEVALDADAVAALTDAPDVRTSAEAHAAEHSIEVELPFLQHRLGTFTLVPLVVGEIGTDRLAEIIESLWGGDETLFVVSTDLSHFLTAEEAERRDLATAEQIETADGAGLGGTDACGFRPLAAFLTCAARRGMRITRLALGHSGDATGEGTRVVGYGAWMAHEAEAARLSPAHRADALRLARRALDAQLTGGSARPIDLRDHPAPLRSVGASFVTLEHGGRLRGCVGSLCAHRALAADIAANAVRAGTEDPRFAPVTPAEMADLEIEIALLSAPARMVFRDEADLAEQLRPGRDGLILAGGERRATFLPKVWDQLATPAEFVARLREKAGLASDHPPSELRAWRYVTESFRSRAGRPIGAARGAGGRP